MERVDSLYMSILQTEARPGSVASAGGWRTAVAGVLVLSGGVGVSTDFVSGMRGRESWEASGVYGGRVEACAGGGMRHLPVVYQDGGHDEDGAGGAGCGRDGGCASGCLGGGAGVCEAAEEFAAVVNLGIHRKDEARALPGGISVVWAVPPGLQGCFSGDSPSQ